MSKEQVQLRLVLPPADDTDDSEMDQLTRSLRHEVLELPVDDVVVASAGRPPVGAKAVDPTTVGTLLVTMTGGGGLLVALVGSVQAWINSRSGRQRVILEVGDAKLELGSATATERQKLIKRFLDSVEST